MSDDREWNRRRPIGGPFEGGGYGEYRQPFRPDEWDQLPPTPYRPQGRPPRPESQADGFASRSGSGPYAGRGPKGYRRSDERVRESVCEALSRDGDLDASEIVVAAAEGELTLEGTVPDRWSKRRAEDVALGVPGVKDVHNRLRVEDPSAGH